MLTPFEYLCRCETGLQLYAALLIKDKIDFSISELELGTPYSALYGPCRQCWIFAQQSDSHYCPLCQDILKIAEEQVLNFREVVLIWCYFKEPLWIDVPELPDKTHGFYVKDQEHMLIMCDKVSIKDWTKNIALIYGSHLKGLLQIFPTMGRGKVICMGDIISKALHHESMIVPDKMRVHFFPEAWQVFGAKKRDEQGVLNFGLDEFLALIEKSKIFSEIVPYRIREDLFQLMTKQTSTNQPFYWGRLQRSLNQKAIDMIDAWDLKQWPKSHIELLYELINYVSTARKNY